MIQQMKLEFCPNVTFDVLALNIFLRYAWWLLEGIKQEVPWFQIMKDLGNDFEIVDHNCQKNKYRGGTSDATTSTSTSLIVP